MSSSKPEEKAQEKDKPLFKFGPFEQAIAVLVVMGFGGLSIGSTRYAHSSSQQPITPLHSAVANQWDVWSVLVQEGPTSPCSHHQ